VTLAQLVEPGLEGGHVLPPLDQHRDGGARPGAPDDLPRDAVERARARRSPAHRGEVAEVVVERVALTATAESAIAREAQQAAPRGQRDGEALHRAREEHAVGVGPLGPGRAADATAPRAQ
jgi:hypothetical protein